ncbi:toll/interleukin-1 receptor domain-containing protein [Paenibacillus tianjinensis]|uniref:TIR domain-containing protein n=1 Tax=Paenibacillus tianjinensis TaxID=2810347 RepID=A0ABX7LGT2_9BACL|nr:TIR domain-containing protein [Paenibacillus tianjinensis]QSF46189.1 TIR domain-containing protein [Paenibacillus tianjinensis]
MYIKEIKANAIALSKQLKEIVENEFLRDYKIIEAIPVIPGQYWEFKLSLLNVDFEKELTRSIGFLSGSGSLQNPNLSINDFFNNNDMVAEEFFSQDEYKVFESLIPLLKNLDEYESLGYSVTIHLNSFIIGGDEWLRQVCEEFILIIHLDEKNKDGICLGTMQSQRYKIKMEDSNQINFLIVPFDKCRYFNNYSRVEGYEDMKYYEYEVAFSFAGEDRELVDEIADQLRRMNVRVFYDMYETVSLWGKDLYTHLDEIYRNKSKYCVMFLSKYYKEKVWTNHERESAQARSFIEREEYILPIRLDDTEIPGIRRTTGYIDGSLFTASEMAGFIKRKVKGM